MRILNTDKGFSLVEALVAIAMASVIVVVIGSALGAVYRVYTASTMKQAATGFAQESMELMTAYRNETYMFACIGSCSDGQSCTPLPNYTSCWSQYPRGLSSNTPLHLVNTAGFWQLQSGSELIAPANLFTRLITIENLCRDSQGVIITCGTPDYNSKKITVTVSWTERNQPKSVQASKILNGWRSL